MTEPGDRRRARRRGSDPIPRRLSRAARAVDEPPPGALDRFAARAADEGLVDVAYGRAESPIGDFLVAATRSGLVRVAFLPAYDEGAVVEELARRISPRVLRAPERIDDVRRQLDEYFAGRRRRFDLRLDRSLMGPFARRVLGRTARIPYGEYSTYAEMAAEAGSPRAYRAAGNALARNPIPIVVPCHRVLASGGGLGGYGGGLDRKRWLLSLEGAELPARLAGP
ncbi:MAG TPA: methylated-DNA--[protein]-cysteine S-methyltransferase [Thermoleophilaceae bacterium]|jgi:methylated-DNA-[protein]-cysteine S-methyltransferase